MLLYISSNENINVFDFLADERGSVIKKLSGQFSLKQFVINDMRSFNHYEYFAIDVKALKDTEDEIIEAILAFKSMFSSRVIFYLEDIKSYRRLISALIEMGIYNIVFDDELESMKDEILKSISSIGILKKEVQVKFKQAFDIYDVSLEEYSFPIKDVKIAVTGAFSRVGTTTMAINLCSYLGELGAKVCYVEANNHQDINVFAQDNRDMVIEEKVICYKGVKYLPLNSESDESFDFIIYDMGVLDMRIKYAMSNKCDKSILCTTGKPYEQDKLKKSMEILNRATYKIVMSLVSKSNQVKLKNQYENISFTEYTPNPFDSEANNNLWEEIMSEYIIKSIY